MKLLFHSEIYIYIILYRAFCSSSKLEYSRGGKLRGVELLLQLESFSSGLASCRSFRDAQIIAAFPLQRKEKPVRIVQPR